jgi:acyl-CoA thioesterase-1
MKAMLKYCLLGLMITAISCGGSGNKNREATKKTENGNGEQVVANSDERVILFFGNSLTAGMGLDPEEAFPSFIQDKYKIKGINVFCDHLFLCIPPYNISIPESTPTFF